MLWYKTRQGVSCRWIGEIAMNRFYVCFATGALLMTSQARAETPARDKKVGLCEKAGGAIATAGAVVSGIPAAAAAAGVAAVPHAAGGAILTSVGTGGTGYIAGTLGGVGATALAAASSPVVIAGAAVAVVGGAGAGAYCYMKNKKPVRRSAKQN